MVLTGTDRIESGEIAIPKKAAAALLANPASVSSSLIHTKEILIRSGVNLKAVFGPQHGFRGETEANMIEWNGYTDPDTGIPVHSLYGSRRSPEPEMLDGIDMVIIDLQDVGTRCYTYIWTAVLMLRACAESSIEVLVLDRPNPITGERIEGPSLEEGYESFVGLFPIPVRHGLTMAEMLAMINIEDDIGCSIKTAPCLGWEREMYYGETSLPWVRPSPNIPHPGTAIVYPGAVMLEGTNISEGRGTTLPFELVGAPFIEPMRLSDELASREIKGVFFRPAHFEPSWDKYAGQVCGGVQIHLVDRNLFSPVRTGAHIIDAISRIYPEDFHFLPPPYEYEENLMPVDIITGSGRLRECIEKGAGLSTLFDEWGRQESEFRQARERYTIY